MPFLFLMSAQILAGADSLSTKVDSNFVQTLDTSTTSAQRSETRFGPGQREFKIDANTAQGKTTQDLIRELPGVQVSGNDQIKIRGSNQVRILLDGNPIEASLVSTIPASEISSIEIQNIPDARQSAEGKGGLILLRSKNGAKAGLSGSLGSSFGLPLRGNIQQSIRYGSGSWSYTEQFDLRTMNMPQEIKINEHRDGMASTTLLYDTMTVQMGNLRLGSEYSTKDLKLGLNFGLRMGMHQKNRSGTIQSTNQSLWRDSSQNSRAGFDGQIYADFGQANSGSRWEIGLQSHSGLQKQWNLIDTDTLQSRQEISSFAINPKVDVRQTRGQTKLNYGLTLPVRNTSNQSSDSLDFELIALQPAIYSQIERKIGTKLKLVTGLRAEGDYWNWQGQDLADWGDWGVYPSTMLSYNLGETQDLHLSTGRRLRRPSPMAVVPLRQAEAPLRYRIGNAQLQSEKHWNAEIGWAFNPTEERHLEVNLFGNVSSDLLTNQISTKGDTILASTVNSGRSWEQGAEIILQWSAWKWIRLQSSASLTRTEIEGLDAYLGAEAKGDLSFRLPFMAIGTQIQGETRNKGPEYETGPEWELGLYARTALGKQANLSLRVQNLLGQRRGDEYTNSSNYTSRTHYTQDPSWQIQALWNFGAKTPKSKDKKELREEGDEGW